MTWPRHVIALGLIAVVALAGCGPDYAPLKTMEAMPESHLTPLPGATLLRQDSRPQTFGLYGVAASVSRTFGTNADIWAVNDYYQSLLQPLGWTGQQGLWTKGGYTFEIRLEDASVSSANHAKYFVVYTEQLEQGAFTHLGPRVAATSSASLAPGATSWPDGLPSSISGEQVFRGADIAAQVREHADGSSFLIGGYLAVVLEPPYYYLVDSINSETPPYVRLVMPEYGPLESRSLYVLRVHDEASPQPCAPAPIYCPPTVSIDERIWPSDERVWSSPPLPSPNLGTRADIERRLTEAEGYVWTDKTLADGSQTFTGTSAETGSTCWLSGADDVVALASVMSIDGKYNRAAVDPVLSALLADPYGQLAIDWVDRTLSQASVQGGGHWSMTFGSWRVDVDRLQATAAVEVGITAE